MIVFALVVTVTELALVESTHPEESLTNNLIVLAPVFFNNTSIESRPKVVSIVLPLTFHQYFAEVLNVPVDVFLILSTLGNPQVFDTT
jgi:hypothetical protein